MAVDETQAANKVLTAQSMGSTYSSLPSLRRKSLDLGRSSPSIFGCNTQVDGIYNEARDDDLIWVWHGMS
jgi:hypothetical protein